MIIATVIVLCNILVPNNCIFNKRSKIVQRIILNCLLPFNRWIRLWKLLKKKFSFLFFKKKKCLLFSFEEDNTAMLFVLQRVSTDSEKEKKDWKNYYVLVTSVFF